MNKGGNSQMLDHPSQFSKISGRRSAGREAYWQAAAVMVQGGRQKLTPPLLSARPGAAFFQWKFPALPKFHDDGAGDNAPALQKFNECSI